MSTEEHVTLRAQWLGQELRRLREAQGLKLKDVAEYLQRTSATVSRFESGIYPVRRPAVEALLDLFKVRDAERRRVLLNLADEVWRTDWWDGYSSDVAGSLIDLVWVESRATRIRSFDVMGVNGLLQTPAYARAVIRGEDPDITNDQVQRMAELRLMRRAILDRENAPGLTAVIDEAALRRVVGDISTHTDQLRYLVELVERGSADVRVLPFSRGAHPAQAGPYAIFSLSSDPYPEVVYVESAAGCLYLEPPKTDRYEQRYDRLLKTALDAGKSVDLIKAIAEDLE